MVGYSSGFAEEAGRLFATGVKVEALATEEVEEIGEAAGGGGDVVTSSCCVFKKARIALRSLAPFLIESLLSW